MMIRFLTIAAVAALTASTATAAVEQFNVHANNHVWDDGTGHNGNLGLATGIQLNLGDAFTVSVDDVNDTWNFCVGGNLANCEVDANGLRPALNTYYGTYSSLGYSNYYGALVGRVGMGDFFAIGTAGFDGAANASGELKLFHWDHNTNNGGSIAVTVTSPDAAVPLPAGLPLLAGGLFALGLWGRKKPAA